MKLEKRSKKETTNDKKVITMEQHNQTPEAITTDAGIISTQINTKEIAIDKDRATSGDIEVAAVLQAIKDQPATYTAIDLIPAEQLETEGDEGVHEELEERQLTSIESLKEDQIDKSAESHSDEDKATKDTIIKAKTKSEVICFRVTKEEYEQLHFQCLNEYGEQLLTVSKLAKLTVLGLSKAKTMEQPLERYRLAIAAEMAMAITALVHKLDTDLEETDDEVVLSEYGKIIIQLENIQKKASMLLAPLVEQTTH